jgi:hypothetical protein
MNEYLRFTITDNQQFDLLKRAFERLKADKDVSDDFEDYQGYEEYFPNPSRCLANSGWDWDAIIYGISGCEYDLISCELELEGTGRLEFYSLAYPYGGTHALQALIECFGHKVIEIYDGGSPPIRVGE